MRRVEVFPIMPKPGRRRRFSAVLTLSVLLTVNSSVDAQQAPSAAINIAQAVDSALRNYPSVSVSQEQLNAAAAGIDLARTAYLPRIDSLAQVNRSTRNNLFGQLLPQGVIPSISGPVIGSNNFGTVWSSAAGALVTWEPFDFGCPIPSRTRDDRRSCRRSAAPYTSPDRRCSCAPRCMARVARGGGGSRRHPTVSCRCKSMNLRYERGLKPAFV